MSLDNIVFAILRAIICKPLVTAAVESFKQVHSAEVVIKTHPLWVISSIYARPFSHERIECVVVYDGHRLVVGQVIFVCCPVVIILIGVLKRARRTGVLEEPIATVDAIQEEVVLLVPIDTHPG